MAEINLRDYLRQIDTFVRRGNLDEAVAHARHVLAKYPKNGAAYRNMARALIGQSQWSQALDVLQRLATAHIDDPWVQAHLGYVYRRLQDLDKALYHYERAFDLSPNDANVIKNLRELYQERYNKPLERIHLTAGAAAGQFIHNGLYDQAINTIQQTLEQTPNRPDLKLMMAQALWQSGRYVDAAEQAFDVLKQLPYCVTANSMLAELWLQEQRPTDAQRFLSRVEDVEPYLAVEIVTNARADDDLFHMEVLNYEQYAQQTLAEQRPEWLETLDEAEENDQTAAETEEDAIEAELQVAHELPEIVDDDAMDWLADLEPEEEAAANVDLQHLFDDMDDGEQVIREVPVDELQRTPTGLTGMLGEDVADLDLADILGEEDERFRPRKTDHLTGMLNRVTDELEDEDDIFGLESSDERVSTGLTGILSKFDEDEDDDLSWLADAQTGRFDTGPLDEANAIIEEETGEQPASEPTFEVPEESSFEEPSYEDMFDSQMRTEQGIVENENFEFDDFEQFQQTVPKDNELAFAQDDLDDIVTESDENAPPPIYFDEDAEEIDENFVENAEIDTGWFESQIDVSDEADETPDTANEPVTGTGSLDPMAWMHTSGVEFNEESEIEQPTFYEEIDDDEVSIGGSEQNALAWMQDSGIEFETDDDIDYDEIAQNFIPTSRLDEQDDDSMAWMQDSGAEFIDDLIENMPELEQSAAPLNDADLEAEATPDDADLDDANLDDLDWADESALEELLEMETLAETGSLSADTVDDYEDLLDQDDTDAEELTEEDDDLDFFSVTDEADGSSTFGQDAHEANFEFNSLLEEEIIDEQEIDFEAFDDDSYDDNDLGDETNDAEQFIQPLSDDISETIDWQDTMPDQPNSKDWEPEDMQPDDEENIDPFDDLFNDFGDGDSEDEDSELDAALELDENWLEEVASDSGDLDDEEELATADADWLSEIGAPDQSGLVDEDAVPDMDTLEDVAELEGGDLDGLELEDADWLSEMDFDSDEADDDLEDVELVNSTDELVTEGNEWLQGLSDDMEEDAEEDFGEFDTAFADLEFEEEDAGETLGELDMVDSEDDLITEDNDWLQGISRGSGMEQAAEAGFSEFDTDFTDLEFEEEDAGETLSEVNMVDSEDDLVTEGNDWLQGISNDFEESADENLGDFEEFSFDEEEADEFLGELEMVEEVDDLVTEGNDWLQDANNELEEETEDSLEAFDSFDEAFGDLETDLPDTREGLTAEMPLDGSTMFLDNQLTTESSDLTDEEQELDVSDLEFEDPFAETFDDELPRPTGMTGLLDNISANVNKDDSTNDLPDWDVSMEEGEYEEPDWLSSLDADEETSSEEPEWLSEMDAEGDAFELDEAEQETIAASVSAPDDSAADPDWLADMVDDIEAEEIPEELTASEPDWLADMEPPDPEATAAEEQAFMSELEDALYSETTGDEAQTDDAEPGAIFPEDDEREDIITGVEAGAAALGMVAVSGDDSDDEDDYSDSDYEEYVVAEDSEPAYDYEEGRYTNRNTDEANVYTTAEIDAVMGDEEDIADADELVAGMEFGVDDDYLDEYSEESADEGDEALIPADNAPDWLNQMVPGLDLDFEAREDEYGDGDSEVDSSHRRREAVGEVPSEDDYGWLEDIVEEETQAGAPPPLPTSVQQAVVIPPRFNFSQPPVWARGGNGGSNAGTAAAVATSAGSAIAASWMDEAFEEAAPADEALEDDVTDAMTDASDELDWNAEGLEEDFQDEFDDGFGDDMADNEMQFDDLGDYEDGFDAEDSDEGTVDELLDDLGLDLDLENFDFDDLDDDDD